MSDRLKSLVVYALQGRYEVTTIDTEAKGHAIELCREAAGKGYDVVVAFGGDGTVNEAANGLIGSRHRADLPPGRVQQRRREAARDPDRRRRRHRAPAAPGRPLGAAHRRPRHRQRPLLHVRRRHGPGRQRRRARGLQPAPEGALRPVLLRRVARSRRSCTSYVATRRGSRSRSTGARSRASACSSRTPRTTRTSTTAPVPLVEGARFDSGCLAGVVLTRARPYDVPTVTFRALSGAARIAAHKRIDAFGAFHEAVVALARRPRDPDPGRRRPHRRRDRSALQRRGRRVARHRLDGFTAGLPSPRTGLKH